MFLESLGADARLLGAFESYAVQGLILAGVASSQRDYYHLYCATGEVDAEPSGAFYYRTCASCSCGWEEKAWSRPSMKSPNSPLAAAIATVAMRPIRAAVSHRPNAGSASQIAA